MKAKTSCMVSSFRVELPADPLGLKHEWIAVATANVFNEDTAEVRTLGGESALLAGAVVETVSGRVTASTESQAIVAAIEALVYQLQARGLVAGEPVVRIASVPQS